MPRYPLNPNSRILLVEVTLIGTSGRKVPLKMVLDTGASMTTVPIEAAIAIGCDPTKSKRRIEMITASGIEYAPVVSVPKIELFGFGIEKVDVVCHNLPPQSIASGLLGLNLLKNFDILIAFLKHTLEVMK